MKLSDESLSHDSLGLQNPWQESVKTYILTVHLGSVYFTETGNFLLKIL